MAPNTILFREPCEERRPGTIWEDEKQVRKSTGCTKGKGLDGAEEFLERLAAADAARAASEPQAGLRYPYNTKRRRKLLPDILKAIMGQLSDDMSALYDNPAITQLIDELSPYQAVVNGFWGETKAIAASDCAPIVTGEV